MTNESTPQPEALEPLLSLDDAARFLGVSRTTVRRLIVDGELAYVRTADSGAGRTLVEPRELRRYIDSRRRRRGPAT